MVNVNVQEASSGSAFIITPRFKIRSEGERVRMGDQIVFSSRKFGVYLHVGKIGRQLEV